LSCVMPCALLLLSGGLRLSGCLRGGSGRRGSRPVKAELRAGGADDGDVHGHCNLVEGVIAATLMPPALMLRGGTLDLVLPNRTMAAIMVSFFLLGLRFGARLG
jgi:hypothetical protein